METKPFDIVNEIVQQLDCGFRVFIHKKTEKLVCFPDTENEFYIEENEWDEEMKEIEEHGDEYHEIDKWTSNKAFHFMHDFAELEVNSTKLKNQLLYALEGKKPFRRFKDVIDFSGEYRERWFAYKLKRESEYVAEQLAWFKEMDNQEETENE
jgi:hypothetical protein